MSRGEEELQDELLHEQLDELGQRLSRIEGRQEHLIGLVRRILNEEEVFNMDITAEIQALLDQAAATVAEDGAAATALNTLVAEVANLQAGVALTPDQVTAIATATGNLKAAHDTLAASVANATPAPPAPPAGP